MTIVIKTVVIISLCMIFGSTFAGNIVSMDEARKLTGTPRYFEDQFNATIECIRRYLKQGDPNNGIPPLDPWIFPEMQRLNIDNIYLWTDLKLYDLVIDGLLSFETTSLNLSNLIKLDVEYHFKKIHLKARYDGQINILSLITFDGQGDLEVELKDVHIKTSTQYNITPPLIDSYNFILSIRRAKITITGMLGEEGSHYLSLVLSYLVTLLVQVYQEYISSIISPQVMEFYNLYIGHLPFLDFLAIITGLECPV